MICLWPYSYGFRTRAKTLWDKLSFAVIFPLPVWLLCGGSFLVFAGRFTALYCLYELGYLYNDYLTVRREKQPNFRLEAREYYRIRRRLPSIVLSRMVWILGLLRIFGVTFEQAEYTIVCRKMASQFIDPAGFADAAIENNYANKDYHKVYVGEIIKVYMK